MSPVEPNVCKTSILSLKYLWGTSTPKLKLLASPVVMHQDYAQINLTCAKLLLGHVMVTKFTRS